jgi:lysophospholipase L1-like esterase
MNRTVKLLAIAIVVLVVLAGVEAYIIQTTPLSASKAEPIRVACVGDSLTRGTEYTLFLWDRLGSGYIINDFGVGGTTVSTSSDKPYMNESAFQLAQRFQPDIVIIMLGTNDAGLDQTREAFTQDYTKLIGAFQALPTKPAIFIVQPPPIVNSTALSNTKLTGIINPAIATVAEQTGATLVDAYTPMLSHKGDYTDGVHPNADGAKIIADTIYSSLNHAGYS